MPVFEVTDPDTGTTLELTGDSPPTLAELEEIFASPQITGGGLSSEAALIPQAAAPSPVSPVGEETIPQAEGGLVNTLDQIITGGVEAFGAIGSQIVGEPLVGLAALGKAGTEALMGDLEFFGEGALTPESRAAGQRVLETMRQVREATTFEPRTPEGKAAVNAVGQLLAPVGEAFAKAEEFIGNKVFEKTKSPALAALSEAIPTLATELFGFVGGKGLLRRKKKKTLKESIVKQLDEATPTTDQLFDTSRQVYKEIDQLGVTVKPDAFKGLVTRLRKEAEDDGLDVATGAAQDSLTPRTNRVLNVLDQAGQAIDAGEELSLTRLDQLRKIAQAGASTLDKTDKSLSVGIIDGIDEFLDKSGTNALEGAPAAVKEVSNKFKTARQLWGRGRRSELLQDAMENARTGATGFENSVRNEFRKIIRNKKQKRFFSDSEISEMQKVVDGSKGANIARLIGKLGFTDGKTSNIIGGTIGFAAGKATGLPFGEVIIPTIGFVSKKLANRLTGNNAIMADRVIRAGKDAEKIAEAYIRSTPINARSAEELSQLLMRPDIDLGAVGDMVLAREAAILARQNRALAGTVVGAGSLVSAERRQEELIQ